MFLQISGEMLGNQMLKLWKFGLMGKFHISLLLAPLHYLVEVTFEHQGCLFFELIFQLQIGSNRCKSSYSGFEIFEWLLVFVNVELLCE
jgi:hypothetical protein